jgi:hypothetical protein
LHFWFLAAKEKSGEAPARRVLGLPENQVDVVVVSLRLGRSWQVCKHSMPEIGEEHVSRGPAGDT